MRLRIHEIARAAGVSIATVSRVINGNYPVSDATRRRVEAVIEEFQYRPNPLARGLMTRRTESVGVLIPFLSNPYHTQIVDAIEGTLSKNGVFSYMCCCNDDPTLERHYVAELLQRKVDGLIIIEGHSMNSTDSWYLTIEADCPVILVNEHVAVNTPHHIIRCAQEPGIDQALERLSEVCHDRIALFGGGPSYSFSVKEGLFKSFVERNGLDADANPIVPVAHSNRNDVSQRAASMISQMLSSGTAPRGVLALNDLIAIGVLQGALAAGARVPDDVAVIGVDNSLIATVSSPRLSTVDLRTQEVGRSVAEHFLELRAQDFRPAPPLRRVFDSRLVLRGTC